MGGWDRGLGGWGVGGVRGGGGKNSRTFPGIFSRFPGSFHEISRKFPLVDNHKIWYG